VSPALRADRAGPRGPGPSVRRRGWRRQPHLGRAPDEVSNLSGETGPLSGVLCLGALPFGTTVDETISFAIFDRFVEAGGTFIDTANKYSFWIDGATGDESEALLGRWFAARRNRDRILLASKVGARPERPGLGLEPAEGLSAKASITGSTSTDRSRPSRPGDQNRSGCSPTTRYRACPKSGGRNPPRSSFELAATSENPAGNTSKSDTW